MGLTNSQGNVIYLSCFQGKITRRVKEGTPGAIERKNKNDKIVHELVYDNLTGMLANIEFREGDYGKEIHFVVKDKQDVYRLQLPYSSAVAKSFVMRLPNAKLDSVMEFHVGWDKDRERQFGWIKQDGNKVFSHYTKEEPNGLPPMEQIKVKGKLTWDDTNQIEFLDNMIRETILPKLLHGSETMIAEQDELPDVEPKEDSVPPINDSDLPW